MAAKEAHKHPVSPTRSPALTPEHQKRLFQSLFFMGNVDVGMIKGLVDKLPNRWTEYPEFLAWAILSKKKPVLEYLLEDGASLSDPPTTLTRDLIGMNQDTSEALQNYRKKPFLTLAASHSTWEIVEFLISKGENPQQLGFIGLSKTRLNTVISTALGAAVFYDRTEIVQGLIQHGGLETRVVEEKTKSRSKAGMVKEYSGCTALLLAVHRGETAESVRMLLEAGADVRAVDAMGNTAMHIAVALGKLAHVQVLVDRKCPQLMQRNMKGETPASIAKERGFHDISLLLGEGAVDSSAIAAASLLISLTEEEEKKKQRRSNRKKHKKESIESSKQSENSESTVEVPVPPSVIAPIEETKQVTEESAVPVLPSLLQDLRTALEPTTTRPLTDLSESEVERLQRLLAEGLRQVTALMQVS